ncbi:MAG: amino acid permease [Luteimonas sp.]
MDPSLRWDDEDIVFEIPGTHTCAACALGALWVCSSINLLGVREVGCVQVLTTVLKLGPLRLFGGIAILLVDGLVDGSAYRPFNPTDQPLPVAVHATVALTLWALLGLEAATVPAGSVTNPDRTIPRATILGTLLAGIATILACTAVLGVLPAEILSTSVHDYILSNGSLQPRRMG